MRASTSPPPILRLVERRTLSTAISRTIFRAELAYWSPVRLSAVELSRAEPSRSEPIVATLASSSAIGNWSSDSARRSRTLCALVLASVKNHSLGFEVSYAAVGGERHIFLARRVAK